MAGKPYPRRPGWGQADLVNSRAFEEEVRTHLPGNVVDRTTSNTALDWWVPGWYLEAKEKRQPLGQRWQLIDGVPERELFVLDELSLRKGLEHGHLTYFVVRDVPGGDRLFLNSAMELASFERVRRQRVGKGKLIYDLRDFRRIDGLSSIVPTVMEDLASVSWRVSECVGAREVRQV